MSQRSITHIVLAGGVALLLGAAAVSQAQSPVAVKVTPASHDFGEETVRKRAGNPEQMFVIQLPPGSTVRDTVVIDVVDPTGFDFKVDKGPGWLPVPGQTTASMFLCDSRSISSALTTSGVSANAMAPVAPASGTPNGVGTCYLRVWFQPSFPGRKSGTIRVMDIKRSTWAEITLSGIGVGGKCVYTVVQGCNYAPMYYGTFSWSHTVTSSTSSYVEDVIVDVRGEFATCNATTKQNENGVISVGTVVDGKGLIAVEFVDKAAKPGTDPLQVVYRITVACPSPAFPATADAAATPSRPADLGDFSQETYEQPIKAIGLDLIGATSQAAPETDPANNVSGRLVLKWSLKRW